MCNQENKYYNHFPSVLGAHSIESQYVAAQYNTPQHKSEKGIKLDTFQNQKKTRHISPLFMRYGK